MTGLALFGIFGAMSSSTASDLEACAPRCASSLREDADGAKTQQTVANVSLVVGAVGLASAAVLWIVWPEDERAAALSVDPPPPKRAAVRLSGSGRADVLVSF